MTFTDIQNRVADRLNLTTTTALTRIGQEINERYREILTGVSLEAAGSGISTATSHATIGVRTVVFTGVEKVLSVFLPAFTPPTVLDEVTVDEIRNQPVGTDPPRRYAIQAMGASTVTILLDSTPATAFAINADAEVSVVDLSGVMEPAFSKSYHDILIHGVLADELEKMEKYDLAAVKEGKFEKRLAELRFFIIKSNYSDMFQGKTAPSGFQNRLI